MFYVEYGIIPLCPVLDKLEMECLLLWGICILKPQNSNTNAKRFNYLTHGGEAEGPGLVWSGKEKTMSYGRKISGFPVAVSY